MEDNVFTETKNNRKNVAKIRKNRKNKVKTKKLRQQFQRMECKNVKSRGIVLVKEK